MEAFETFRTEAARIRGLRGVRAEQSLYGPFGNLLNGAASELGHPLVLAVHQVGAGGGAPDFGVYRGEALIGWVELKAPDKNLDTLRGHDLRQHERALEELECFVLSNGWDFRLFESGQLVRRVVVRRDTLRDSGVPVDAGEMEDLAGLLDVLFSRRAMPVATADEAVRLLARRAQAIKREVAKQLRGEPDPLLGGVYEEFEGLVYRSGRPYSREDFADAYAQTGLFGLLLARTGSGHDLSLATAADDIDRQRHPFLWRCLHILTDPALPLDLRALLEEAVQAVNRIPPDMFARQGGADPLLYAYETFFAAYDPTERAARGVFYTPPFVVAHQVSAISSRLRDAFGLGGLADPVVRYLDPATGTGTYLLGLLLQASEEAEGSGDPADAVLAGMVRDRVRAFELMVGPYTVAHQRIASFLSERGVDVPGRLPIYLVDTLAETLAGVATSRFGPLGAELADERQEAEEVKSREPVLVVLGNPPYDRIHRDQLGDHWLLARIDQVVELTPRGDRVNLKALYDFYVAFWRWALWLVGEREVQGHPLGGGRGIITYITNRSWIVGRAFGGLRSLFTEMCREVWVVDLGADLRSSRTRVEDDNVFDVRVGVAIVVAVVDLDHGEPARTMYRRIWGRRADKERELSEPFDPSAFVEVIRRDATEPLLPVEWGTLTGSPGIEEIFLQRESGIQTSRDSLLVGIRPEDLLHRGAAGLEGSLGRLSRLTGEARQQAFRATRTHPVAPTDEPAGRFIVPYAYRPLDYRYLYNDPRYVEWPRPGLQTAFGDENVALVTIERGFGRGPAAFPISAVPDLHVFRGFGGARAVYPLYGYAGRGGQGRLEIGEAAREVRLAPAVLEWARGLNPAAGAEEVFAYVCSMLGAPSYTVRFEGGLVAERPRVPLTAEAELFEQAVRLGSEWVDRWTLAGEPPPGVRWVPGGESMEQFGDAVWEPPDRLDVGGRTLAGVTEEAWSFEVSGYQVLPRYCRARRRSTPDEEALRNLRAVAGAVVGLVEIGPALDEILERIEIARLARL